MLRTRGGAGCPGVAELKNRISETVARTVEQAASVEAEYGVVGIYEHDRHTIMLIRLAAVVFATCFSPAAIRGAPSTTPDACSISLVSPSDGTEFVFLPRLISECGRWRHDLRPRGVE